MDVQKYCAYNRTRECFLSQEVIGADGALDPLAILKVLIEGLALDAKSGFWLKHLADIPSVPRLSPFDLVYLDRDNWVIQGVEVLPGTEVPPLSRQVASALVLPLHTISSTNTNPGDRLVVCLEEEVMRHLALVSSPAVAAQVAQFAVRMEERSRGSGSSDYSSSVPEGLNGEFQDEELVERKPQAPRLQPASTAALSALKAPNPQHENLRTSFIPNSITPTPSGQKIEFTLAQSPGWRISSPTVSTSLPKTKQASEGGLPSFHASTSSNGFKPSNGVHPSLGEKRLPEEAQPPRVSTLTGPGLLTGRNSSSLLPTPSSPPVPPVVPASESGETRDEGSKIARITSHAVPLSTIRRTAVPENGHLPTAINAAAVRLGLIEKLRPKIDGLTPKKLSGAFAQGKSQLTVLSHRWLGNQPRFKRIKDGFLNWLNDEPAISDRRRAPRNIAKGVVAYYWTGGAPKGHKISDISATGFYMQTEDRWVPETMLQMTLQRVPAKDGRPRQSIAVLTRVVRKGVDGVGHEFVMTDALDRSSRDILPARGTDKMALERFL